MTQPPTGPWQPHPGYTPPPGYPPYPQPPKPKSTFRRLLPLWIVLGVFGFLFVSCVAIVASSGSDDDTNASAGSTLSSDATSTAPPAAGSSPAGAPPVAPTTKGLDHAEDVAITECAPDRVGWAAATVTVTNHSSKPSNYIIEIVMESPDGKTQIGTGLVSVSNLAPGQQTVEETSSLKDATGPYVCRVGDITRYAS